MAGSSSSYIPGWVRQMPVSTHPNSCAFNVEANNEFWRPLGDHPPHLPGVVTDAYTQFDAARLTLYDPRSAPDPIDLIEPKRIREWLDHHPRAYVMLPFGYTVAMDRNISAMDLQVQRFREQQALYEPGAARAPYLLFPPVTLHGGIMAPKGMFKYWTVPLPLGKDDVAFWDHLHEHLHGVLMADSKDFAKDIFHCPYTRHARGAVSTASATFGSNAYTKFTRLLAGPAPDAPKKDGPPPEGGAGDILHAHIWDAATKQRLSPEVLQDPTVWYKCTLEPILRLEGLGIALQRSAETPHWDIRILTTLVGARYTKGKVRPYFPFPEPPSTRSGPGTMVALADPPTTSATTADIDGDEDDMTLRRTTTMRRIVPEVPGATEKRNASHHTFGPVYTQAADVEEDTSSSSSAAAASSSGAIIAAEAAAAGAAVPRPTKIFRFSASERPPNRS